ncbi:hypothetical protein E2C01_090443 [Portunus trituberculatus]|uniref:Uncharacterized protein n=1 Tax=Portunus trituberculatus TaxID=210409 RepID=A0A5B7JBF8_PORTR|nr:hypothetical protein [Portunus trituberculatus]
MADHRLIKRRDLPGYCPQRWCAVCGKAATKTVAYVRCEGRRDCPNVCHSSCLGDQDAYMCGDTQELRRLCNIEDVVVYLHPDEDVPTPPAHPPNEGDDGNDVNTEEVDEWQHYRVMGKEDPISYALHLGKELTRKNNIIQSLTLQRDWILEKKTHVAELNEFMEVLTEGESKGHNVNIVSAPDTQLRCVIGALPTNTKSKGKRGC